MRYGFLIILLSFFFCPHIVCAGAPDSTIVLTVDMNDHTVSEAGGLLHPKAVGASLVEDRFGNAASALSLNGHINSYLSLGSSSLLRSPVATISIWVNLQNIAYAGTGYKSNPILVLKNGSGVDFNLAYSIQYDLPSGRMSACTTKDSMTECIVKSINDIKINKWYHFVITNDDKSFALYVNGKLQGRCDKDFTTQFLESDSLMIGNTADSKNERYTNGVFDDIQIFHRVLSEQEIGELYTARDPNRFHVIVSYLLMGCVVAGAILLTSFLLVHRRRKRLQQEQERLQLIQKMQELEIRSIKAQMNPHFVFNSLNSILKLIISHEEQKAEIYLIKFSKLIRELLENNANDSISVKEEVEILSKYIEMEALRFETASFLSSIEVDERIDQERVRIPHMMIQPMVENAIWYGLLPKPDDRCLSIRFEPATAQKIKCTVYDNGIGRAASRQRDATFKKRSLGLSFITQRLELMSAQAGIDLAVHIDDLRNDDGTAAGTRISIELPVINNETYVESDNNR